MTFQKAARIGFAFITLVVRPLVLAWLVRRRFVLLTAQRRRPFLLVRSLLLGLRARLLTVFKPTSGDDLYTGNRGVVRVRPLLVWTATMQLVCPL